MLFRSFSLLQQAGFPVARWAIAADSAEAAAAAARLRFPVVLKAERPGLVHKSDAGAVRLGLNDRDAVIAAFEDFCHQLGEGLALVQEQITPGVELTIGAWRDPAFGPVVMTGLGGVWIEVLKDTALRLAPVEAEEALAMLDELKGQSILRGLCGRPPVDVNRFARLIADLSHWSAAAPWLSELDLNPIIVNGDDFTIVDTRMRVADRSTTA